MAEPRNVNIADIDPYNLDEDVVDKFAAAAAACYSISSGLWHSISSILLI